MGKTRHPDVRRFDGPPPVLSGARILSYAVVDDTVAYKEQDSHFIDCLPLGPVPRLAICQDLGEPEIMIIHCDDDWDMKGVFGGYSSVEEAKSAAERSYGGLLDKWIDTSFTEDQARDYLEHEFAGEKCSFCGRIPIYVEKMIGNDGVRICNHCIDEFHERIHARE